MRKTYENKIPDPGEHFSYVVLQPDTVFDLSGKKLKLPKADRMEFIDIAKELGRSIDLSHYFKNTITSLCARFIMYDEKYEPVSSDKIMQLEDPDEKYKQINEYAQKRAKKWVELYIKKINVVNGIIFEMMWARGVAYQRAYKNAETACSGFTIAPEEIIEKYNDFFCKLVYHM